MSVSVSVRIVSRSICQKSANLWQSIIGRILNSNLIYNIKIRHPSNCDDLVLRTQKVASGPPLPCGCNLVKEKINILKNLPIFFGLKTPRFFDIFFDQNFFVKISDFARFRSFLTSSVIFRNRTGAVSVRV